MLGGIILENQKFYNVREHIENAIKEHPDNIAFKIKEKDGKKIKYKNITYKKMQKDIFALGTAINNMVKGEKRVAIIGKNSYSWALTYLATLYGNNIVVPLDKGLPDCEIKDLIKRSKANIVVFEDTYAEIMNEMKEEKWGNLKHYICMTKKDKFKTLDQAIEDGKKQMKKGDKKIKGTKIDNKKMAAIIFTSGTTSLAKGVMLSQYNIATNLNSLQNVITIYDNDVNMAFLPFHHTFGSTGLMLFLSKGATNVFCDGLRHIQKNLEEYKVSIFVCVPLLLEAMYKKIMQEVKKQNKEKTVKFGVKLTKFLLKFKIDIRRKVFKEIIGKLGGNLRYVVSGASAIDRKVAEGFNNFGIITVQGYGLTETSPVLTAETESTIRYGSIGHAIPEVEIKIEDKNEEGIGEIVAKGPNVMLGYYENEEETNKVLKDGWFYTGDLAYQDKDGYIFIAGRKKNVIVLKNGKNVYPEEIEILISNLPYVAECMVFGKEKDDDLIVSAKIVYNKEYVEENYKDKSQDELKEMIWQDIKEINKDLTTYKHIKHLIVTDEPMVKTSTAKVKRYEEIKNT